MVAAYTLALDKSKQRFKFWWQLTSSLEQGFSFVLHWKSRYANASDRRLSRHILVTAALIRFPLWDYTFYFYTLLDFYYLCWLPSGHNF
ncbi:hypothetical protein Pfo_026568 [Paulownia fortunei]|nr:hypothetical protein Pfo_026568 [Paulownia fortunei]